MNYRTRRLTAALAFFVLSGVAACGSDPVVGFFPGPIDLDGNGSDSSGPDAGDDDGGADTVEDDATLDVSVDVSLDTNDATDPLPDAFDPDVPLPDVGEPDVAEPDVAEPDSGEPDSGEPDTGEPDSGEPDSGEPDSGVDVSPLAEQRCDDGVDNDGDGRVDCGDDDCFSDAACIPENCLNNIDDDGDGRVDCADEECALTDVCVEICDDDLDNDRNGLVDCRDAQCFDDPSCATEICDNGRDDDRDRLADCSDPDCFDDPACTPAIELCFNGVDDDGDGAVDCADRDCAAECSGDGACTNSADAAILGEIDLTSLSYGCAVSCFAAADQEACTTACVETETGLSPDCSACAAEVVACGSTACLFTCIAGPDSPECLSCIFDNCAPSFEECAGISFPG